MVLNSVITYSALSRRKKQKWWRFESNIYEKLLVGYQSGDIDIVVLSTPNCLNGNIFIVISHDNARE